MHIFNEKGRDLIQSYDKSPFTDIKSKKQRDNTKAPPKNFDYKTIAADLRRSDGVTIATQLVWLNWFTRSPPSH